MLTVCDYLHELIMYAFRANAMLPEPDCVNKPGVAS